MRRDLLDPTVSIKNYFLFNFKLIIQLVNNKYM